MRHHWRKLKETISKLKRFSLQKLSTQYCTLFKRERDISPAYAWLKCEREEDKNCYETLEATGINGRTGSIYTDDDHYVLPV